MQYPSGLVDIPMRQRKEAKAMGNTAHDFLGNGTRKKIRKAEIS
jgi:hypothetical protein